MMNYIGSKKRLSVFILDTVKNIVGDDLSDKVFCDLFAGTGIVGQTFKSFVKQVISNDWEYYSFVLNKHYIENGLPIYNAEEYIEVLNEIPLKQNGFIYQNYCLGSGSKRNYFSDRNGQRIDTARQQIDYWRTRQNITDNLYYFLLSSLLESVDKVANTACVYSAFLKHLKKSAQKPLVIKSTKLIDNVNSHKVYQKDACEFITETYGDILYLDPPYNNRQYGATYHLLNTIAQYREFNPKMDK